MKMKKQLESNECEHCFGYDENLDDNSDYWAYSEWLKSLPTHERLKIKFKNWWLEQKIIRKVLFFAIIIDILAIIVTTLIRII